jgi:hypothetical protein
MVVIDVHNSWLWAPLWISEEISKGVIAVSEKFAHLLALDAWRAPPVNSFVDCHESFSGPYGNRKNKALKSATSGPAHDSAACLMSRFRLWSRRGKGDEAAVCEGASAVQEYWRKHQLHENKASISYLVLGNVSLYLLISYFSCNNKTYYTHVWFFQI